MRIGFVGLGKMGMNMTTRLLKGGHEVVAIDVSEEAVKHAHQLGAEAATTREELLIKLESANVKVIWLMIPAQFVESEIDAWCSLLPAGSILIDGGNSDYRETLKRVDKTESHGINFVDVGTSGGILGVELGYSMMVGGSNEAIATIAPFLDSLAQPKGWGHFGPTGSGHYIKMIHNGIEYGVMQAYAEGFHLLKDGPVTKLNLAAIADVWQHGSIIASSLNGLSAEIFETNPELTGIDGYVAENGEARWTLDAAEKANITMPVVKASLEVRVESQQGKVSFATKYLAALRNAFGGHQINR